MGDADRTVFTAKCRKKLIQKKEELLNLYRQNHQDFNDGDHRGDEGDQTLRTLQEHHFLATQHRLRSLLLEIETALARMDRGIYGVCEETGLPIEDERLLAIPWTRLSLEGAEIRESKARRYSGF